MGRALTWLLVCLVLVTAGGCKTLRRPEVSSGMILPAGASRLQIPPEKQFLMPAAITDDPPTYPAELVASEQTATVCVEVVVDDSGSVESARPLYGTPGCPDAAAAVDPRFTDAAVSATRQWQFAAAAICTYPVGVAQNPECTGVGVSIELVAVKLAFVFEFRVESGRRSVRRAPNNSSKPTPLRGAA